MIGAACVCVCVCMGVCMGSGQCYVRLTVQAFTVARSGHREGGWFTLSNLR